MGLTIRTGMCAGLRLNKTDCESCEADPYFIAASKKVFRKQTHAVQIGTSLGTQILNIKIFSFPVDSRMAGGDNFLIENDIALCRIVPDQ